MSRIFPWEKFQNHKNFFLILRCDEKFLMEFPGQKLLMKKKIKN